MPWKRISMRPPVSTVSFGGLSVCPPAEGPDPTMTVTLPVVVAPPLSEIVTGKDSVPLKPAGGA